MKTTHLKAISIIEVLIAGGILAMILGSSVALSRTVTKNQIIVQDRTMANSLASEAIEQIHALNDTTKIDGEVNDFKSLLPTACASNFDPTNSNCQGIELSWDQPNKTVYLEKDNPPNPAKETDPNDSNRNNDNEVIVVDINPDLDIDGVISDNIFRKTTTDLTKQKTTADCLTAIGQSIVYCRKISVLPIVININNPGYLSGECDANGDCDNPVLPNITEEDPSEIVSGDEAKYTFDALDANAFKVTSEVSWYEFGKQRTVSQTDIITNW